MEAPGNIKFDNGKGLSDLCCQNLAWIEAANEAVLKELGVPDGPFTDGAL